MSSPRPAICVFAGSSMPNNPALIQAAEDLGRDIADEGLDLVYGGGLNGLMGVVAKEAFNAGANVHAVVCAKYQDEDQLPEMRPVIVKDEVRRFDRFLRHENLAGFVVLPGGPGTMRETMQALEAAVYEGGPHILLTKSDELSGIKDYFDKAVKGGSINSQHRDVLKEWQPGKSLRVALKIRTPFSFTPGVAAHIG